MGKYLLCGWALLCSVFAFGQSSYQITNSAANVGSPGSRAGINDFTTTGGTVIHDNAAGGGSTTNSWSSAIALPTGFNMEFFGTPVTHFCVSKNGLLTFDTTVAGTTVATALNTNVGLPSVDLPDQTIAYFWENFATSALGGNDDIWMIEYGTAPNREVVIHNHSYRMGSMTFSYFQVIFVEGSNTIYIVDNNYKSNNCTATLGMQENSTTAVQVTTGINSTAGSPNIIMGTGSFGFADNEYYQFDPFVQVPNNVGVASIDGPGSSCGLTATETVSVTIENIGTAAQSGIPVMYSLNGGPFTSGGTLAGPLSAGNTATHTFTADLSAIQTHHLIVVTNHTGDTVSDNDTAEAFITNIPTISTFPYMESFESGNGSWASEESSGSNSWELGPPTDFTINSASDGVNAWVTDLDANYPISEESFVRSPCFDFTSLTNPEILIDIWYETEFSWDGAVLQSSLDNGQTWTTIGANGDPVNWYNDGSIFGLAWSGGQVGWTGSSGSWQTAIHDLTGLGGQASVMLRVAFGSDNSGVDEGFAFDNVIIREKLLNDAALVSFNGPFNFCGSSISDTIEIEIGNGGGNTIQNIPIMYSIDGGGFVSGGIFADSITTGNTALYNFPITSSGVGAHTIAITTVYPGDPDLGNDTTYGTVSAFNSITSYPYMESFESGAGNWASGAQTGSPNSWELGAPANATINSASDGTQAWVTNLTGDYANDEMSFVEGLCFDFTSLTNPEILLDIWIESETSWDGAALQASTDGGQTWAHVGAFGDPNNWHNDNTTFGLAWAGSQVAWTGYFGSGSNGWVTAQNDLTGLGGLPDVRLRIAFGSDGTGTGEGFAFDNVIIREKPLNNLGISGLNAPNDGCGLGLENLEVIVENFGAANQSVYNISFTVNGGPVVAQAFSGDTVFALDTIHLTLDSLADLSTVGPNNLVIWTELVGDQDVTNDTFNIIITNEAVVINTFPHLEDWEGVGVASSGTLSNGWTTTSTVGNFGWESENSTGSNENSTITGPFYDHTFFGTPGGIYMYLEASSGTNNTEEDELISPCIDLGPLTNPAAEFWYHMHGSNMGTLLFEINSGGNWTTLWSISGQQHPAGGDPWIKVVENLAPYAGQAVKFRFRAIKGNGFRSDMAVDDFRLFDVPINDAGVIAMNAPATVISPGSQNVEVAIQNFGIDTLFSTTINWEANGAGQTPLNWTGALATDSVDSNLVVGSFNFTTGLTELTFYTSVPNGVSDDDNSNDTLEMLVCTPLSGTFTIGATGDFDDFGTALSVLQNCGMGGAVTLQVIPGSGPYNEQIIFTTIPGLSATNTLTVKGNMETVTFTPTFSDKRIIGFDGAKHITIDSLTVTSGSPTYGFAFHFMNASDSNTVSNCVINLGSITSTGSTNSGGFVASNSITSTTTDGNNTSYSVFTNNQILGSASGAPYQGFYLNGQGTGANCVGNQITNNVVENFYRYGVYLDEADGTLISGNDFSRPDRTASTTTQFITMQGKTENTLVEKNALHNSHGGQSTSTSTTYGIYSTSNDADVGDENIVQNNLIYDFNSNGTIYGIYNFSSNGVHYFHNTISLDNTASTSGTTRGVYQTTTASNLEFRNNIISITRGGSGQKHGLYFNATGSTIASDNNDIFLNSAGSGTQNVGRYGTTNYATLANWQTANSSAYDQNSFSVDPNFVDLANDDLEPNSPTINNVGANLGITDDFFGASRGSTPDPGAIEFDVATTDVGVLTLVSPVEPASPGCELTSSESISVIVKNFGTSTITSVPLSYSVNGGTAVNETFGGLSLAFNDTMTLTFSTTANLSGMLDMDIQVYSTVTGDLNLTNDTLDENLVFGIIAPYFEDFESLSNENFGVLNNGWVGNQTSDPRWEAEDAAGFNENSVGTGPLVDHTLGGAAGGIYMFMETSSGTTGQEAELESPCIDLSVLTNPFLRYWYHMHGATMGNLYVDIYSGGIWTPIDSLFGQQQANQADPWEKREIDLCDYDGQVVRFRFRGQKGTNFTSDFSIDDFEVLDMPPFNDAAVTELVVDPMEYCQRPLSQAATYNFTGTIANRGTEINTNVTATLTAGSVNETANFGSMADCGTDTTHAFTGTFTPTAVGEYPVTLNVTITENDTVTGNDADTTDIIISDTVFARDDSTFTNGIGSNTAPIEIGQVFEFLTTDTLTSVSFYQVGPVLGDSVRIKLYNFNGVPTTVISTSTTMINSGPGWYTQPFCGMVLSPGEYFVAVEQLGNTNMSLGYSLDKFTDSTVFFSTGGGIWTALEAAGFPSVLLVRANLGRTPEVDISSNDTICNGDTAMLMASAGFASYSWSTGDTTATIQVTTAGTYTVTATDANGCTSVASGTVVVNSLPVPAIASSTNVSCNGLSDGSATASATSGQSPYMYLWSSGGTSATETGLAAGTYSVTVTDANGCSDTTSVTITEPAALSVSIASSSDVLCNGGNTGTATAAATGGTMAYNYLWSTGSTGATESALVAGTHTVTVTDANGCTATTTVSISEPAALLATASTTANVSCNGLADGSASSSASGGTMPYTYAWSSGGTSAAETGLAAGTYTVTITDANGCTTSANATVTEPTALTATITSQTNVDCNGNSTGSATVTASGGTTAYNYLWSSGGTAAAESNLAAGTYTVTVTDANGCTQSATVTITEPATLAIAISGSTDVLCNGDATGTATTSTTGGTMPYTYSWSTGETGADELSLAVGTHSVTVTDANGCTSSTSVSINEPTAITSSIDSIFNVTCGGSDGAIRVVSSGGTGLYTYLWPSGGTNALDTGLFAGTYTVTVTDANGCTDTVSGTITQPSTLAASVSSQTDVLCNGDATGAATIAATGGVMPYTYLWSSGSTTDSESGLTAGAYSVSVSDANGCLILVNVTITEPTLLTGSVSDSSNISCNAFSDGYAIASASGGVGPYTYAWSNAGTTDSIGGLTAGAYTVTITDANGCTISDDITLTEPNVLVAASVVDSNVTCNGLLDGGVSASATGGTSPYTYLWSNGGTTASQTGLASGTYSVTITDANGCTDSASSTVTEPQVLVASIASSTNVDCNGNATGSATVAGTGGTTAYAYAWSSGGTLATESGLTAGGYTVTITDANGCTDTAAVTITEPTVLQASITSQTNVSCNGLSDGDATAIAGGGTSPYTYLWSSGGTASTETNLSAGTYTVTATDANGCTQSATVTISEPTVLQASITSQTNVSCNGLSDGDATVSVSGGTSPYTYNWSSGGTAATENNLAAGTYTVTATDANGCTQSASVTITEPLVLQATITGQTNVSCNGLSDGDATVSASGGTSPYTYNWSSGGTAATESNLSAGSYTVTITDANGCTDTASVTISEPAVLVASITGQTNVSCNGLSDGDATVAATGGTSPYTYVWSSGGTAATESNLAAGTYTVTVTDANGCTDTASVVISEPTVLVASISGQTNVSCNGLADGTATAMASGGTTPYTYTWPSGGSSATDSGLVAGTYVVTVTDANGCTDSASVVITEPNLLVLSLDTLTDVSCNGGNDGAATVSAVGGTMPYQYLWSNGDSVAAAAGLAAGTYMVTVTDSLGCTDTLSATIGEPTALSLIVTPVDVTCAGGSDGSISVLVSGGTGPYGINWSTGDTTDTVNNLPEGTYLVGITDANGCLIGDSGTIGATNPVPVVDLGPAVDTICTSFTYTMSAGSGFAAYVWSDGSTDSTLTVGTAGTYWVRVTDANGCTGSDTITLVEDPCVGLPQMSNTVSLKFFPNPTDGLINMNVVGLENETAILTVISMDGRIVYREELRNVSTDFRIQINLETEAQGIYFVNLTTSNNTFTERISVK